MSPFPANDERSIEVLASGLPHHHLSQLAVDITLRSALTAQGLPCPGAASIDGSVLHRARRDKERKYHELIEGEHCRLIVVALETVILNKCGFTPGDIFVFFLALPLNNCSFYPL